MYCPKCGTENPHGAQLCRSCNYALTDNSTSASAPNAKTSKLAVISVALAVLTILISGTVNPVHRLLDTVTITALIFAMVLGVVSIFTIEKSAGRLKGKATATAGVALAAIFLILASLIPVLRPPQYPSPEAVCQLNLRELGIVMKLYSYDHDSKYPSASNWCDLLIQHSEDGVTNEVFQCPKAPPGPFSYGFNKCLDELRTDEVPSDTVLLFETDGGRNIAGGPELLMKRNRHDGTYNILFADFSVRRVTIERVKNLKWKVEKRDEARP